MAAKTLLFVEGEPNTPNGDLRQGLAKLLEKRLPGKLPRIILGGGKSQTIHKFLTNKLLASECLLLIDLDKPEVNIQDDLRENDLLQHTENAFYMVQEMEGWFLSQPDVLDKFYGKDQNGKLISEKLSKKRAAEVNEPDRELQRVTNNLQKPCGEYHKIKHAVELLKLLDVSKLVNDFSEFRRLIERLQ
jgi:hypothetical protein